MKVIITFDQNGISLPDEKIDEFLNSYFKNINFKDNSDVTHYLSISNELVILALRCKIMKEEIDNTKIEFRFKDNIMTCDGNGRFNYFPEGFCESFNKYLDILLMLDE